MEDKQYVTVTFEVDAELAEKARAILNKQGYTLEDAIVLFYEAVAYYGKIPFPYDVNGKIGE